MSSYFYGFPIVAYVSLALDNDKSTALSSVQEYCREAAVETDIFAEDVLPQEEDRPLWQKVLNLVDSNEVSIVVVPSLAHIAGDDQEAFSSFLTYLKIKGVRLKSLTEGVDSQRDSRLKILSRFKMNKETSPALQTSEQGGGI